MRVPTQEELEAVLSKTLLTSDPDLAQLVRLLINNTRIKLLCSTISLMDGSNPNSVLGTFALGLRLGLTLHE